MKHNFLSVNRLFHIYIPYCTVQYFINFYISLNESLSPDAVLVSVCFLKTSAYTITCFFHSNTFCGQRLLSLKNNGKVHLHLIIQYEKIRTFLDPIRENIGRSRGTNKGRSLDECIRCRIIVSIAVKIEYLFLEIIYNFYLFIGNICTSL